MSMYSFNEMYLGVFNRSPSVYQEVKKGVLEDAFYEHDCPKCSAKFYGYKRRFYCFDCNKAQTRGDR